MVKFILVAAASTVLVAAQSWKDKKVSDWTEDEAKEVLTDSPWAKPVAPQVKVAGNRGPGRGGITLGGPGIGVPMGRGRGGRRPDDREEGRDDRGRPPQLTLRWESARPVQEAALKAKITDEPAVPDEQYGVAVLGLPSRMVESRSKLHAELKREGKPAIKSTDARVISRDDGIMVLFLFPRTKEISTIEREVEFSTTIGQYTVKENFNVQTMVWNGEFR